MKPVPKLDDADAMLVRGRRSALHSARNEACEAMRDASTKAQSMPIGACEPCLDEAEQAIARLREIARLWEQWKL